MTFLSKVRAPVRVVSSILIACVGSQFSCSAPAFAMTKEVWFLNKAKDERVLQVWNRKCDCRFKAEVIYQGLEQMAYIVIRKVIVRAQKAEVVQLKVRL
jgi:hypothetical protein